MHIRQLRAWALRLANLFSRNLQEREFADELESHLQMHIDDNLRAGMNPQEARRQALIRLGGISQTKEEWRRRRGIPWLEDLWQDMRYSVRGMLRQPSFTVIAVITLALGIGANTAIFSLVNSILLKSLPFPDSERLIALSETTESGRTTAVAYPDYLDWRAQNTVFENMTARMPAGGVITGDGEPERVMGRMVTASFFPTIGIAPQAGRFFTEQEDQPGADPVIVLSFQLWQRRYGSDPLIIGRTIQFNGESWTVLGVAPARFDFYGENNLNNQFFIPLGRITDQQFMRDRNARPVSVTARLKENISLEEARAQMHAIAARVGEQFPQSNNGIGVSLRAMLDDYVGDMRPALLMLMAAVGIVLLIACTNVANLLLARAATRQKEIALRIALGAGRLRIVRQLMTESLLLAVIGGTFGLVLSMWGIWGITHWFPEALPRVENISVDLTALGFTLLVTLVTGIAFGLAPALQVSKADVNSSLKESCPRSTGGVGGRLLRSSLVIAEVALSLILLISAGLLVKSFWRLMMVEPGFDSRNVLTLRLRLPDAKYREVTEITTFLKEVSHRVEALPGVNQVSLGTGFPLGRVGEDGYWVEGQPEPHQPGDWPVAYTQSVSESYHHTLGIQLISGRYFNEHDKPDSPKVVIVDDEFVRRHFPNSSPDNALGHKLRFDGDGEPWREIVGVVRHVRQTGLDEEARQGIYSPWTQINPRWAADYIRAMDMIVKTSVEPTSLVSAIKGEVQTVDKDQPLGNVRTLEASMADSVSQRRFSLLVVGIFAGVALLLGCVGLYGVLSYVVTQRTREIGIRMALGAQRKEILRLIISQGMAMAIAGIGFGIIGAFALTRLMSNLLFGVSATDPQTFILITLLLLIVALAACYLPALRATRVDPLVALRYD